jgi:hypothetical protein
MDKILQQSLQGNETSGFRSPVEQSSVTTSDGYSSIQLTGIILLTTTVAIYFILYRLSIRRRKWILKAAIQKDVVENASSTRATVPFDSNDDPCVAYDIPAALRIVTVSGQDNQNSVA